MAVLGLLAPCSSSACGSSVGVAERTADALVAQVSAFANFLPGALFILAAFLVLKPVGVRIALGASLMTCALIFVGMQYAVGLEAALFIYAVASVGFGIKARRA